MHIQSFDKNGSLLVLDECTRREINYINTICVETHANLSLDFKWYQFGENLKTDNYLWNHTNI